jgi:hypothetical protein
LKKNVEKCLKINLIKKIFDIFKDPQIIKKHKIKKISHPFLIK